MAESTSGSEMEDKVGEAFRPLIESAIKAPVGSQPDLIELHRARERCRRWVRLAVEQARKNPEEAA